MALKNIFNANTVSIFVAFLGIIVPIIWVNYESKASISVYRKSSTEIKRDNIGAGDKIEIMYNGLPIEKLNISLFLVENTGNKPIKSEDVKSPLRVRYDGEIEILEAHLVDQHPKNLGARIKVAGSDIIVEQDLLNQGDSFVFKVVSSGSVKKISADARIADISEVEYVDQTYLLASSETNFSLKDLIILSFLAFFMTLLIATCREIVAIHIAIRNTFKSRFIYELSSEKIKQKISELIYCGLLARELENFKEVAVNLLKKDASNINDSDRDLLKNSIPKFHNSYRAAIFSLLFSIVMVYSLKDFISLNIMKLINIMNLISK